MHTILVVDDEEGVRMVVSRMLKRLGIKPLTCATGAEAVDIFGRQPDEIDCVIVDLTMAKMDGVATFSALRAIRADARVVLATGLDEEEAAKRVAGLDFAAFIKKPFTLAVLEYTLNEMLRGHPAS